jgi:hypothetical protein
MKRIIILGMALIMTVVSIGGCFIPYEGRDRGERHEEGGGHDRDRDRDRDGGHYDRR